MFGTAGLVALGLTFFAEPPDDELGTDAGNAVGTGGLADGVGHLARAHQCGFQHLALHQLPCGEQLVRFRDHRLRHAVLAHHQGGFQAVRLRPELGALFTCQHMEAPFAVVS